MEATYTNEQLALILGLEHQLRLGGSGLNSEFVPSTDDTYLKWLNDDAPKDSIIETQKQLIDVLEGQVVYLSIMSKIELGDDVIAEIQRLKSKLK